MKMINVLKSCALCSFMVLGGCKASSGKMPGIAEEIKGKGFVFKTKRLEAVFKNGMIVNLKNLGTGEVIADESLADYGIPRGMGAISGNVNAMCKLHIPWGCSEMKQHIDLGTSQPNLWRPCEKSKYKFQVEDGVAKAEWVGLSNGKKFIQEASLRIQAWEDKDSGSMCFKSSAFSPEGGVFGVQVPLANIKPESKFFMPHFGGMLFDRNIKPALRSFGGAPFYEAPIVALEGDKGSLGIWKEDEKYHPYYAFLNWSGKSFSFSFEHLNMMPFEPHKDIESVTWKLDVFDDGWTDAMTPFKKWYEKSFAREFKIRDSVEWAKKIRVVIDMFNAKSDVLRKVAETFDPETVMFQTWNARAPNFDRELPDWTPREGYIEKIKALHDFGFKAMAYVNTYCANYNSAFFKKDGLTNFFLTRKASIWKYDKVNSKKNQNISEMLIGTTQGVFGKKGSEQFKGIKDGKLLYGDPLSPGWRKYHVDLMKWWNKKTGTDANYEDTAGCWGDFGNGVIDGKYAGQGSVAMMRELLEAQPDVPMASEYGPAPIAFAVKWPLIYAQVWGNKKFREFRMHRQFPIGTFLFGNRPWIPVIRAESDFLMHLVTACSDALGGMAQFYGNKEYLEADKGMLGLMKWRAQIFSRRRLVPYFEKGRYEKDLVCMYKDFNGGIYKYYDNGKIQKMLSPKGRELYGRIDDSSRIKTNLFIPGWPAFTAEEIFGLNPKENYALFPGVPEKTDITLTSLPKGAYISRYYQGEGFAVLSLQQGNSKEKRGRITLLLNRKFREISVNGKKVVVPQESSLALDVDLPANILFSDWGRRVKYGDLIGDDDSPVRLIDCKGMDNAKTSKVKYLLKRLTKLPGNEKIKLIFLNYGGSCEKTVDYLIKVPGKNSSLKLFVKNSSSKYGNGSIFKVYIDGKLVKSIDCAKANPEWSRKKKGVPRTLFDTNMYELKIPVGAYSGQNALVSVATDSKNDNNSDSHWYSHPELINDKAQNASQKIVKE